MGLNLHSVVRGAITTVVPDVSISYLQSIGSAAVLGKRTPTYAAPVTIRGNVQPVSGGQMRKYEFLQGQGVYRSVHLYGDVEGIVRSMQKGGDLLKFADPVTGGAVATWLVTKVDETWNVGWCRVIVTLQLDPNNP